jgi:calcineurin-like phosphoesterase family protein
VRRAVAAALVALVSVAGGLACGGDGGGGGDSGDRRGKTAPEGTGLDSARSSKPAVLWAVGDGADGGPASRRVGRLVERGKPDRFLYLGDVYEEGTKDEYKNNYEPAFGGRLARVTAPTPGNHEWPRRDEGYRPYWKSVLGKEVPDYYKFTLGGWEIVGLNSEAPHHDGSPQVRWLRSNLRGDGTCRLAFWHRARFSFGDHGDQPDVTPLWNALRGRAVLIVVGHEHNTERFAPRDGLTELVAGAGGRGIYKIKPEERTQLAFGNDTDYAALRLRLRPGRADYRFVAAGGRTMDSGSVRCRRSTENESQPVSGF